MDTHNIPIEPYTLKKLGYELSSKLPEIIRGAPRLISGFIGQERLTLQTRLAVQLRLAKLLGCPVCLNLFPRLGAKAGLDEAAVQSAIFGSPEGLEEEALASITWIEAILRANGETPEVVPATAMALSSSQRAHLLKWSQLEIIIHSLGLFFLPHRLIEKAVQ